MIRRRARLRQHVVQRAVVERLGRPVGASELAHLFVHDSTGGGGRHVRGDARVVVTILNTSKRVHLARRRNNGDGLSAPGALEFAPTRACMIQTEKKRKSTESERYPYLGAGVEGDGATVRV